MYWWLRNDQPELRKRILILICIDHSKIEIAENKFSVPPEACRTITAPALMSQCATLSPCSVATLSKISIQADKGSRSNRKPSLLTSSSCSMKMHRSVVQTSTGLARVAQREDRVDIFMNTETSVSNGFQSTSSCSCQSERSPLQMKCHTSEYAVILTRFLASSLC